jgi:hypothetical protein
LRIEVGQLARAVDPRGVGDALLEQCHIVGPKRVVAARRGFTLTLHPGRNGNRAWITRARHDPDAAVLGKRARRPTRTGAAVEPLSRVVMGCMVGVQQRDY